MAYAVKCIQTGAVEFVGTYRECQDYIADARLSELTNWKKYRTQAA